MPVQQDQSYGCVFCKTGGEDEVARQIQLICPEVKATAVFQEKYKSQNGKKSKIKEIMLPGYVFFEAACDTKMMTLRIIGGVIRVLTDSEREWTLTGKDREFACWLFQNQGCVGFSTAYKEGNQIRILSGPLKDLEGQIVRIDKRGRSGQVAIQFDKREIRIWLGFELINKITDGEEIQAPEEKGKDE